MKALLLAGAVFALAASTVQTALANPVVSLGQALDGEFFFYPLDVSNGDLTFDVPQGGLTHIPATDVFDNLPGTFVLAPTISTAVPAGSGSYSIAPGGQSTIEYTDGIDTLLAEGSFTSISAGDTTSPGFGGTATIYGLSGTPDFVAAFGGIGDTFDFGLGFTNLSWPLTSNAQGEWAAVDYGFIDAAVADPVPEPASFGLLGISLLGLGVTVVRRRGSRT